ncbi:TonB-dependent receptor [Phenylobacterium sp. LH3H17]|uniref:TonB-dependent receptor n=1 Tax=Phenylobacterium sp. LH3H17 TaxID=2903901 RepID=UPI0020C9C790|nr:TonB-dependent receptor [Phenylobacterium sp. LH3H17]UTP38231.1 TonB-dependent receptor [Phenylobacterium sp. LH3H17]
MNKLGKRMLYAGSCLALLGAGQAHAQARDSGEVGEVIVTGSRIKRTDIEGVGPATVIGSPEIAKSGIVTVEALLQRLPAAAGYAGNQGNAYWAARGWGTATVNLRGLGINRTLVLLNGRRLVNGGTGANSAPDLNTIPTSLIGRIEVLKDGASAIYGTDAIAGVVNIITRENFEGLEVGARYGVTDEGDGSDFTADLAYGVRSDRGGLAFAASYQKTQPVNLFSRAGCQLNGSSGSLICLGGGSTAGGRASLPTGQIINFTGGNTFAPYSAALHGFDGNIYLNAVSPIERLTTGVFGDYQVTDAIQLFGEFLYTHRETDQSASPGTLTNFVIPASNPTNPTGQQITLIQRRLVEAGSRIAFQETNTYQVTAGARGKFAEDWTWEAAANYGRTTGSDGFTNIANKANVANTINTAICSNAPGAAIPCADYLGPGDVSPAVLKYIMATTIDTGGNETINLSFDTTGSLFQLPAGPLQVAAGATYRKDKGWRNPDNLIVLGVANSNQQSPIRGAIEAVEGYAELSVPLLKDMPLVESLRFDGAIRYSDYKRFGSDVNYKAALDWSIAYGLRARATWGTAFRVPNVAELFSGVTQGQLTTTDPCSRYSTSTNATLRANCQAAGVPANYIQPNNAILTTTGGNLNLTPEEAETLTLGLVWEPEFVPGLSLTLDYFKIDIDNAIRSIPGSTKLSVCYNTPGLVHPFCTPQNFTRNSLTGEVNFLSSQQVNVGAESVKGIDAAGRYSFDLMDRRATLDAGVTYLKDYTIIPYPGGAPIIYRGHIGGGNGGYPKWRGLTTFTLDDPKWSASYTIQWIGKATDFNAAPTALGYQTPNVFYHNAQFSYRLLDEATVAFGVDNLFEEDAPYLPSYTDGNTDTMTYDLVGRRGYVRLTYKF